MSDTMLIGILRMTYDLWSDSAIDKVQRQSAYIQAADRIEADENRIAELEQQLEGYERLKEQAKEWIWAEDNPEQWQSLERQLQEYKLVAETLDSSLEKSCNQLQAANAAIRYYSIVWPRSVVFNPGRMFGKNTIVKAIEAALKEGE